MGLEGVQHVSAYAGPAVWQSLVAAARQSAGGGVRTSLARTTSQAVDSSRTMAIKPSQLYRAIVLVLSSDAGSTYSRYVFARWLVLIQSSLSCPSSDAV